MQSAKHNATRWRRRLIALIVVAAVNFPASDFVLAQGGSVGGSIGKQGKSASGDHEVRPPQPGRSEQPRKSTNAASSRSPKPDTPATGSISGVWRWTGQCTRFAEPYTGTITVSQSGNSFSASHGGTNMWDAGTISNGRISGNRVSFTRTFGQYSDHLNLNLSRAGRSMRMAGTISTAHSGQCQMRFTKG